MRIAIILGLIIYIASQKFSCDNNNSKPMYGEETGLPKNCRAIVQANIDGIRSKQYTVNDALSSLERNCGANGYSWNE
ncbi:MAG: hypothetical protein RL755_817 [Pseudomonadota bacterium]|jgi:hypothetical protein